METPITFPVLSLFPHHWHFSWLPLNGNSPKLSQFLVFSPPSLILLLAITKSNGNSQELSLDIIRSPALSSKPLRIFSQVLIFFYWHFSGVTKWKPQELSLPSIRSPGLFSEAMWMINQVFAVFFLPSLKSLLAVTKRKPPRSFPTFYLIAETVFKLTRIISKVLPSLFFLSSLTLLMAVTKWKTPDNFPYILFYPWDCLQRPRGRSVMLSQSFFPIIDITLGCHSTEAPKNSPYIRSNPVSILEKQKSQ